MILHINTTETGKIKIALSSDNKIFSKISRKTNYNQAEILLPAVDTLLKKTKKKLKDIKKIKVENRGGGFTSLRIGVITANALAYGLGVRVEAENGLKLRKRGNLSVIGPVYSREPDIG